jgi:SDR family mycofactocin-dependent oxidoreductase
VADDAAMPTGRCEGKVALITGAARGQGRCHALRLAEEGADIIAIDICRDYETVAYPLATQEDLRQTVAGVEALGRRIVAREADVRDGEALRAVVDEGVAELGRLDVVVANAGVCTVQPWNEVTPQAWRDVIDTNLTGVWNTCVHAAPHLIAGGGGSMILTSSTAGLKGMPFVAPYVAAKHGVVGIMRLLAIELGRHSIRVNTLHPTGVDTPMGAMNAALEPLLDADPDLAPLFMNVLPVELTEPNDQSNAVLFLACDESRYVTGLEMKVDAGYTLR